MLLLIHGEGLMPFIIGMYLAAVLGWTVICYLIIKYWMRRKKQKRERNTQRD